MVCLGNICRSPLAEGLLRKKLKEKGVTHIHVDSAGTSAHHEGELPDSRTRENALNHNLDISDITSRPFKPEDFERFDRIYVMDQSNMENVLLLARKREHETKVDLLLNCLEPGCNKSVPDPYFGGPEGFEKVFTMLDKATENLANELLKS